MLETFPHAENNMRFYLYPESLRKAYGNHKSKPYTQLRIARCDVDDTISVGSAASESSHSYVSLRR